MTKRKKAMRFLVFLVLARMITVNGGNELESYASQNYDSTMSDKWNVANDLD